MNNYEMVGRNLYKANGKYYRLFGHGVTPNGCWIIAPELRELVDIDIATGLDIFGSDVVKFDVTGSIPASGKEYITESN